MIKAVGDNYEVSNYFQVGGQKNDSGNGMYFGHVGKIDGLKLSSGKQQSWSMPLVPEYGVSTYTSSWPVYPFYLSLMVYPEPKAPVHVTYDWGVCAELLEGFDTPEALEHPRGTVVTVAGKDEDQLRIEAATAKAGEHGYTLDYGKEWSIQGGGYNGQTIETGHTFEHQDPTDVTLTAHWKTNGSPITIKVVDEDNKAVDANKYIQKVTATTDEDGDWHFTHFEPTVSGNSISCSFAYAPGKHENAADGVVVTMNDDALVKNDFMFASVDINKGDCQPSVDGGEISFDEVPGGAVITIHLKKAYTVTYDWTGLPDGADVDLPMTAKEQYEPNEEVVVDDGYSADSEVEVGDDTYIFSGWSIDDIEIANNAFTMPAKSVIVKGEWTRFAPVLSIEKKAGAEAYYPGDVITYTITVTNSGIADAENVTVTDELPAGLTLLSADGEINGTESGGVVTWTIDTIPASETVKLTVEARIAEDYEADTLKNTAVMKSEGNEPGGEDIEATEEVDVNPHGALTIQKVNEDGEPLSGAVFSLTRFDEEVASGTTGEDGMLTFEKLKAGEYTLDETRAPTGYQVTGQTWTITVNTDGTVSGLDNDGVLTIANSKLANVNNVTIKGTKVIQVTDGDIIPAGTSFSFTLKDSEGNAVNTATVNYVAEQTAYDVEFNVDGLAMGTYTYTVTETEVENWTAEYNNETVTVEVKPNDENTALVAEVTSGEFTITNTYTHPRGSLKIDNTIVVANVMALADGSVAASGTIPAEAYRHEYTLTVTAEDSLHGLLNDVFSSVTFVNGVGTVTVTGEKSVTIEDLPAGTYTVTAADGDIPFWSWSTISGSANVPKDREAIATVSNTYSKVPMYPVTLVKNVVADDGETLNVDKTYTFSLTGYNGGIDIPAINVPANGSTEIRLPAGEYTLTEADDTDITDYIFDGNDVGTGLIFTVGPNGVVNGSTTITNYYIHETGTLTITKEVVGLTADLYPDEITFTVTSEDGKEETVKITGEDLKNGNGTASVTITLPTGKYTITEKGADVAGSELKATVPSEVEVTTAGAEVTVTNTYNRTYELVYDANGGSFPLFTGINKTYTGTATSYTFTVDNGMAPERDGYRFMGWGESADSTDAITEVTADLAQPSRTVYAIWEKAYTVTYQDNANGTVFADRVFRDLLAGENTPAFDGTLIRSGYTFNGWSPAVEATVSGDAIYVAQWRANGGDYTPTVPTPSGDNDPDDGDSDDDPTDIVDEDVPLTDIPADDVPLTDIPEDDVPLTDIPEEDVPLADAEEDELMDIFDEDVPLADVPQTGDNSYVWFYLAILSAAGLLCLLAIERKNSKKN